MKLILSIVTILSFCGAVTIVPEGLRAMVFFTFDEDLKGYNLDLKDLDEILFNDLRSQNQYIQNAKMIMDAQNIFVSNSTCECPVIQQIRKRRQASSSDLINIRPKLKMDKEAKLPDELEATTTSTTKKPSTSTIDTRYLPVSLAKKPTQQPWTRTYRPISFKHYFTIFPYTVTSAGSWYTRKNAKYVPPTKPNYQREHFDNGIEIED